jgi:hypothetical protein
MVLDGVLLMEENGTCNQEDLGWSHKLSTFYFCIFGEGTSNLYYIYKNSTLIPPS